jgi:hypothetical protein
VNMPVNVGCELKLVINIKFQSMYPMLDWTVCWCKGRVSFVNNITMTK